MTDPVVAAPAAPAAAADLQGNADAVQAPGAAPGKILSAAALRALEEAALRRAETANPDAASEAGGPKGLEPTRFGDWERKGLAVDF